MTPRSPFNVVLDWGTSSFRAMRIGADSAIHERIETRDGIQGLARDQFPLRLMALVEPWRQMLGKLEIIAAGMVGSRNGWVEMPYLECPADAATLASGARRLVVSPDVAVTFLPGLTDRSVAPFPDVMRGEETQLVGLGLDKSRLAILPGTHSKWARIGGGRIGGFRTFVTGELFAVLAAHSFIASMAERPPQPDWQAFARGIAIARDLAGKGGGLVATLFSLRTGWLAGEVKATEMPDLLSGLVIGTEFSEALALGFDAGEYPIALIGNVSLMESYRRAAAAFGLATELASPDCATIGALAIGRLIDRSNLA